MLRKEYTVAILIFFIASYVFLSISLYLLFKKTEVEPWKGLVPGLNFVEWAKLIGRKPTYPLWLLFPVVNIFIFCGMAVDLVRSFKKYDFLHTAAAVIYAPAIFTWLATKDGEAYDAPTLIKEREYMASLTEAQEQNKTRLYKKLQANNPYKKTASREWVEAIVFAVFAAAFISMFLIEAYKIPTPSMEGSLLVGDFLFVSKAHYGIRTPMTPVMIPLLHNRVPIIGGESYLEKPSLPYWRLPALESIDRGEPFVFNWPVGDSVYLSPSRSWTTGQYERMQPAERTRNGLSGAKLITRPIDKKDHYIKRAVGAPGDNLEIRNRQLMINGEAVENPKHLQFLYRLTSNTPINSNLLKKLDIDITDQPWQPQGYFLSQYQIDALKEQIPGIQLVPFDLEDKGIKYYPHNTTYFSEWSTDNYGPIWIPKKGETIELTPQNIILYERVMNVYEGNDSYENRNGKVFINGREVKEYTFKQDYFWAMGDNRHNSEDSRMWGFVPHDHVVGKPLFIWFSTKHGSMGNGINWSRLFTSANK